MKSVKLDRKKHLFTRKRTAEEIEEEKLLIKECYEFVDKTLEKFYDVKSQDELYIELTQPEAQKEIAQEIDPKQIEELKLYVKGKFGKEITDLDAKKLLTNDEFRTTLSIDSYMSKIIRILNQTKVVRRSSDKPMMTPKSQTAIGHVSSEAHLTTRGMHQEQVGDLSAEIAEYLGLNVELARLGGKHHDDGHTNSGHTGERIATMIGRLSNCGYIVHNALSADMLINEGIINQVIEAISKEKNGLKKEQKIQIKNELWRFFDILISHNGEGHERIIKFNPKKTVNEIIEDKNKCYTQAGYDKNIIPGSKEAALVAFVDRICYVRTDILDGVGLGILTEFNDEYLKYIGILAAKYNGNDKLFNIANRIFEKEEELERQLSEISGIDVSRLKDKDYINSILENNPSKKNEFINLAKQYLKIKEMSKDVLEASLNYGKAYVSEIPMERRKEIVTNMIKDVCVEDLKTYSYGKDYIGLSPAIAKAFFGIRTQNLEQIVKFTRRKYERESLPQAELKIQRDLKEALLDSGIIHEYLNLGKSEEKPNENSLKGRRYNENMLKGKRKKDKLMKKYGLREKDLTLKNEATTYKGKFVSTILKNLISHNTKYRYERKVIHKFTRLYKYEPDRLREIYNNCISAVDDITMHDVEIAIGNEKIDENDILSEEYIKKIEPIKKEIQEKYLDGFSEEGKRKFIKELANRRKNNKEEIFASALALEYTAGMADCTLLEAAKIKKYLTNRKIKKGYKRGAEPEKSVEQMGNEWKGTNIENTLKQIIENDSREI